MFRFQILVALVILGLLLGCAPSPTVSEPALTPISTRVIPPTAIPPSASVTQGVLTPTPVSPAPKPRYGGSLTEPVDADLPSMDLHQEATYSTGFAVAPMYNGLIQYDPADPNNIIPDLAETWDVSADGLTYTFHLRKGVKWHDGVPMTSQDAKHSFDRIRNPPQGTRSPNKLRVAGGISQIDTPDDYTLKIGLTQPKASFLSAIAIDWAAVLPKHVIEREGSMLNVAVGTGPFKFKSYQRGVSFEVVKNPDYFIRGRPYLDRHIVYIIPDAASRFAALRVGNVLMIRAFPGIATSQKEILEKSMADKIRVATGPHGMDSNLTVQVEKPHFTDRRVRQAISYALDRDAAVKVLNQGWAEVGGLIPPFWGWSLAKEELATLPGYGPDKEASRAKGRELLAQAGFPNGLSTTIMTTKESDYQAAAVFSQDQLAKIGIKAEIRTLDKTLFYNVRFAGDFDLGIFVTSNMVPDPDSRFTGVAITGAGLNFSRYSNPEFDKLYLQQSRTVNVAERKEIIHQMEKIYLTDAPANSLIWHYRHEPLWNKVKGWVKPPHHLIVMKLEHVWLSE